MAALMAAEQPIQRDELQQWDASARAWLQTADSAMEKEYIQLKLILRNISLPVTSGSTLYDDIIRAWTQAMYGLERLLNGEPQSITNGAILLAISAWHLYPSLLVLGRESTNVNFGDRGIQSSGLLTVGITNSEGSRGAKEGIYWSMALSHYRYYGRALNVLGEIDDRLTIDQLHLVAFGSLLSDWSVPKKDFEPAARWLNALEGCLSRTKKSRGCPPWLPLLAKAARDMLNTDSPRRKDTLALVGFGYRRGINFLHPRGESCLPWFGLRFRHIFDALASETPVQCAVKYLRSIARAGNLRHNEALITCITSSVTDITKDIHQYFTANTPDSARLNSRVTAINDMYGSTAAVDTGKNTGLPDHQYWSGEFIRDGWGMGMVRRVNNATTSPDWPGFVGRRLPTPLKYYRGHGVTDWDALLPNGLGWFPSSPVMLSEFIHAAGPTTDINLWLVHGLPVDVCNEIDEKVQSLQSGASAELLDIEIAIRLLNEGVGPEPLLFWQYLDGPDPYDPESAMKEVLGIMETEREKFETTVKSLRNLELATDIYNRLEGATISSSIVQRGLHDVQWAVTGRHNLTRSMVFSCIAMMETGKIGLDTRHLDQVIALSSGNSLFVATRLLTDPYDEVADSAVTRIVGNVGRSGVNLLVPPIASPLTRSLSTSFRAAAYAPFNGLREDNFKGTTLHLSFTSHKFPLDYGVTGIVDHQVFFVESVISIHDSGQWVADLDTLEAFNIGNENRVRVPRRKQQKPCTHPEGVLSYILDGITSIDTWEEVLDTCPGVNIIRAHKNWPARLAASVMLSKTRRRLQDSEEMDNEDLGTTEREESLKQERYLILENGDNVCWVCLHRGLSKTSEVSTAVPFYIIA